MQLTAAAQAFVARLNIAHPIVQAPMSNSSTARMAAAVSAAGGLGSIGVGSLTPEKAKAAIAEYRSLSQQPLNVNVFCHRPPTGDEAKATAWLRRLQPEFAAMQAQPPKQLTELYASFVQDVPMQQALLAARPEVVSFHFGLPKQGVIDRFKHAGIYLLATATSLEEAMTIQEAGVDAVVAQGFEAGGHRGVFDLGATDERLPTSVLVRLLVRQLRIPVVAAGGLMTGEDIAGALRAGAAAAQLGTAFLLSPESAADVHHRRLLKGADSAGRTVMTQAITGRPARCLAHRFTAIGMSADAASVPDYPLAYDAGKALHRAALAQDNGQYGAYWSGQGAPFIREMSTTALMAALVLELAAA